MTCCDFLQIFALQEGEQNPTSYIKTIQNMSSTVIVSDKHNLTLKVPHSLTTLYSWQLAEVGPEHWLRWDQSLKDVVSAHITH